MAIFSAFRRLTGSTAEVHLIVEGAKRGEKAKVTVAVNVGSDALKAKRIYLKLAVREVVDIPNYSAPRPAGSQGIGSNTIHVRESEQLHHQEIVLAPAQELAAGSTTEFKGEIGLPANLPPSFAGKHVKIEWQALAGVDTSWSTDPSSGWQDLFVE